MPAPLNLLGQRFGRLLVIERVPRPEGLLREVTYWKCRCECGTEVVYSSSILREGRKWCGRHRSGPPGASGRHAIFCQYRCNAKARGIPFELGKEEFLSLTSMHCRYCGVEPRNPSRCGGNSSPQTFENSLYLYNGIDRVDNSVGYVITNCVPCCKQCNRAKTDMTVTEFFAWVARVHSVATSNNDHRISDQQQPEAWG